MSRRNRHMISAGSLWARGRASQGGPAAPSPHRYWRIRAISGGSGSGAPGPASGFWSVAEQIFRTTPGGRDLVPAVSIASSERSGFEAANAHDENEATCWSPDENATSVWLGCDLGVGGEVDVSVVTMAARIDSGLYTEMVLDFDVEYSDNGISWVTAWEVRGEEAYTAEGETRTWLRPG